MTVDLVDGGPTMVQGVSSGMSDMVECPVLRPGGPPDHNPARPSIRRTVLGDHEHAETLHARIEEACR